LSDTGLAIEAATEHVEVLVCETNGAPLAHEIENVGHGHTRRLAPLVRRALESAGRTTGDLAWVAADLGPGSFTGVRVGLATAHALAGVARVPLLGASSLVALALGAGVKRALVVPLVPAGRREHYAGFFRADPRGIVNVVMAPEVATVERTFELVAEVVAALKAPAVRFVGPGVGRVREALEAALPGSTSHAWRAEGLSALDLAAAVRSDRGPAAGLPMAGAQVHPLYVRPAQAEESVRRRVQAAHPATLRDMSATDVPAVAVIERQVFSDPWSEAFFLSEMRSPFAYSRIAEKDGAIAGYSLAWLGEDEGHLGNIAVAPGSRRQGIARALLEDLLAYAEARGVAAIALEVRVSNFPAQWLYRAFGFRVAGLRRRYYRDTGEDALVMRWSRSASDRFSATD
jgi:tRNA threonylcarbamoyladenosine biosynthesis protein TsaB